MTASASHGPTPPAQGDWRVSRFPQLMLREINQILLVSSPYDAFTLEEDGLLTEMIQTEYADLGQTQSPKVTHVSTGAQALEKIETGQFDLVITLLRLGDMDVTKFCLAARRIQPGLPVVLLVANEWELARLTKKDRQLGVDGIFLWHGDAKIFVAINKLFEDRMNAADDTKNGDVGVIILVEDSVRFRSSLLPIIYSQLVLQTRAVMAEGLNHTDKQARLAARPKVLLAENYEEALAVYEQFRENLFGIITDVAFARQGEPDPIAGVRFIRHVRAALPDLPVLMQSSEIANARLAADVGARFLHKRSPTLLQDVQHFMLDNFGFGDFIFRLPGGREVGRAHDLQSMARVLREVPAESIEYHARHNHFSTWFRARTEFALARQLRPRRVSEFSDTEALRRYLVRGVTDVLRQNRRGVVEDFSRERFDTAAAFARIGGGSLGGKARGLAFVNVLLARNNLEAEFPNVRVHVPRCAVIGTDVFDEYLDLHDLRGRAMTPENDAALRKLFLDHPLPDDIIASLRTYLDIVRGPIAVRSSSLLEDSQYHPFAGVYDTHMLPNNHADDAVRLARLHDAIRLVYASTYCAAARHYIDATPHRIDEERMAVILQPVVGAEHEHYYYPDFSGVARAYNYYPFGAMKPDEGVAGVALGLCQIVVEGGNALRFCPAHPQVLPQLGDPEEFLNESQHQFYAIDLRAAAETAVASNDPCVVALDLADAERHGTLHLLGSVWSDDNQAFFDGISRPGARAVTFAHILKNEAFPLAALLVRLLKLGREGLNSPVEIEFAVNLQSSPREFAVLQLRPSGAAAGSEPADLGDLSRADLLCLSPLALGNGFIRGISDVIYVKPRDFNVTHTTEIAAQIGQLNESLLAAGRQCLLIGPGRWGSSYTSLGIPVNWSQINSARAIVETTLEDFMVEPSQGSHFFQNLTSAGIAYLTVNPFSQQGFIDWPWLDAQPAEQETPFVRHVRLKAPLEIRLDGRISKAAVLKRELPPPNHADAPL